MSRKRVRLEKKPRRPKATQVHEDSRTQRERTRGDQVRKSIQRELDEVDNVLRENER